MTSRFYDVVGNLIDSFLPKRVCRDSSNEPWLTRELRNLGNWRNRAYKNYLSDPSTTNSDIYAALSSEFEIKSLEAYDEYRTQN